MRPLDTIRVGTRIKWRAKTMHVTHFAHNRIFGYVLDSKGNRQQVSIHEDAFKYKTAYERFEIYDL